MRQDKRFTLNVHGEEIVDHSVFISGSSRSGTTIMGKFIGSLDNFEYYFEPPTLFQLFADADNISERVFKGLVTAYLYEDLYCGSVSGRSLNFRKYDDSYIYNMKTQREIEERLNNEFRKSSLNQNSRQLAFKIPDFVYREAVFQKIFPESKIVRMVRDPSETISSLIQKAWFSSENIKRNDLIWPSSKKNDVYVPHFVPAEFRSEWAVMTETDRCLVYYLSQTPMYQTQKNTLVIRYEDLIHNPEMIGKRLKLFLHCEGTPISEKILQSIHPQVTTNKHDWQSASSELVGSAQNRYQSYTGLLRCDC